MITTTTNTNELRAVFATARVARSRAEEARHNLEIHLPILLAAIRISSRQAAKVRAILKSLWNGEAGMNEIGLCDTLTGLDGELAEAILSAIAARLFLAGDADAFFRPLLDEIFAQEDSR
jgi:hypothetical protein